MDNLDQRVIEDIRSLSLSLSRAEQCLIWTGKILGDTWRKAYKTNLRVWLPEIQKDHQF